MTSTLRDSPPAPSWDGAACRGHDPDLWFPTEHRGVGDAPAAPKARAICRRCPLQEACAEYALAIPDLDGLWGGLSAGERRRIRAERAPADGRCLCGCTEDDHRLRWAPGRRKRGGCTGCGCVEYVGVDGG